MPLSLLPLLPPIVLLGPPGAGKSSVGAALAVRLGYRFVDLDVVADAAAWRADDVVGEARVRVRETLALRRVVAEGGAVVIAAGAGITDVDGVSDDAASGGDGGDVDGAPDNAAVLARCLPVLLSVPIDVCAARMGASPHRPWLSSGGVEALRRREAERARAARRDAVVAGGGGVSVDAGVDGDATLDVVVDRVIGALADARLPFSPANDLVSSVTEAVSPPLTEGRRRFVVADDAVAGHLQGIQVDLRLSLTPHDKSLRSVEQILVALSRAGVKRTDLIVAVGGGLLSDVVGLAAALHQRGTPWRAVPTTLLAMVDASFGGKTAVDVDVDAGDDIDGGALKVRNGAGAFWAPESAAVYTGFLSSLPHDERRGGRAEMLKHALLWGAVHVDALRAAIAIDDDSISRSRGFKAAVVARDPLERHLRAALNLGHTVGHALEARWPSLRHGDAVLHGLKSALWLSTRVAGLDAGWAAGVRAIIDELQPTPLPLWSSLTAADHGAIAGALGRDKKGGRFVLLRGPGDAVLADQVDDADVAGAVEAAWR